MAGTTHSGRDSRRQSRTKKISIPLDATGKVWARFAVWRGSLRGPTLIGGRDARSSWDRPVHQHSEAAWRVHATRHQEPVAIVRIERGAGLQLHITRQTRAKQPDGRWQGLGPPEVSCVDGKDRAVAGHIENLATKGPPDCLHTAVVRAQSFPPGPAGSPANGRTDTSLRPLSLET